ELHTYPTLPKRKHAPANKKRAFLPPIISHNSPDMRFVTSQRFGWLCEKRYLIFTETGPIEFAFRPTAFLSSLGILSAASLMTLAAFHFLPPLSSLFARSLVAQTASQADQPRNTDKPFEAASKLISGAGDYLIEFVFPQPSQTIPDAAPGMTDGASTKVARRLPERMLGEADETSPDLANPEPVSSIMATRGIITPPMSDTETFLPELSSPAARPFEEMDADYVGYNSLSDAPILDNKVKFYRRFYSLLFEIRAIERLFDSLSITPDNPPSSWDISSQVSEDKIPKLLLLRESWRDVMGQIPLKPPMRYYYISSKYGPRKNKKTGLTRFHHGVDMAGTWHSPVLPAANGTVVFAGRNGSFGKVVRISHAHGMETIYAHLSDVDVKTGDYVTTSTVIGKMGNTGKSQGMHLHYEVRTQGKSVDPVPFLKAGHEISLSGQLPSHLNL
ncbi:MAG: M23 family metallopeptidase, partial [Alphaproteobacteria bacterium]|nr:M23 family metallopeptidase [Alphaproteobacteria bacterium]